MQTNQDAAKKAAAILRENEPLNAAEQAATDAVRGDAWVLWHTSTIMEYSHGVIRLLSRAGLLRDKADEARAAAVHSSASEQQRRDLAANLCAVSSLYALVDEAAHQLDAGTDPAKVAEALRQANTRIFERREQEQRPPREGDAA